MGDMGVYRSPFALGCPWILVSGPWVITLADFRVDGMVGIQGSGWIRLPPG